MKITIEVPDGYEKTTHVVLIAPDVAPRSKDKYVHVLRVNDDNTTSQVEEIGGGPLSSGLTLAARVIREDKA